MSNKTPTDAGSEMWFLTRMYPEAYYWACAVDEDTAHLIVQAYDSDEIAWETAKQLWWEIVGQAVDPSNDSESISIKRPPQMADEEGSRPKQNFKLKDYKKELRCKI